MGCYPMTRSAILLLLEYRREQLIDTLRLRISHGLHFYPVSEYHFFCTPTSVL